MDERNGFFLQTTKQMNLGAAVSGIGFLLYLAASALGSRALADGVAAVFGLVSIYVFVSIAAGRRRDKEAVSYNLLWGQAALMVLLVACAVLGVKQRLGI